MLETVKQSNLPTIDFDRLMSRQSSGHSSIFNRRCLLLSNDAFLKILLNLGESFLRGLIKRTGCQKYLESELQKSYASTAVPRHYKQSGLRLLYDGRLLNL